MTAEHLGRLEHRIAGSDVEREKGRAAIGAGVAIAVGATGLWARALLMVGPVVRPRGRSVIAVAGGERHGEIPGQPPDRFLDGPLVLLADTVDGPSERLAVGARPDPMGMRARAVDRGRA